MIDYNSKCINNPNLQANDGVSEVILRYVLPSQKGLKTVGVSL